MAKTFKQFQQDIQEIDQNMLGPGLGVISAVGNAIGWLGKKAFTGAAMTTLRNVKGSTPQGSTPQPNIKKIPKWKGPGGDPSGSGIGQAQQRSK